MPLLVYVSYERRGTVTAHFRQESRYPVRKRFIYLQGFDSKVSAGNSGHPKTPDTWYISAMDESFGLKLLVLKHLPLGYI